MVEIFNRLLKNFVLHATGNLKDMIHRMPFYLPVHLVYELPCCVEKWTVFILIPISRVETDGVTGHTGVSSSQLIVKIAFSLAQTLLDISEKRTD